MDNKTTQKIEINSITKKVMVIVGLAVLLLVPLSQVETQMRDRRYHEELAQKDVAKGWGDTVTFTSPELTINSVDHYPLSSQTSIKIDSQEKKRGLFKVPVYVATLKTKINFNKTTFTKIESSKKDQKSEQVTLAIKIKPISSIQSFKVRDVSSGKELNAYLLDEGIFLDFKDQHEVPEQIDVEVSSRGTGEITYSSNSDSDQIKMYGNWIKPMFAINILPTETKVTGDGFEAHWTLNALPKSKSGYREAKSIGLSHLWVGTDYSKIEKAMKYGILFIALTFLLVFVVELMSKVRVHPFQYGLIGLALSLFYLLLLAISETIGFDWAYLISSLSITGLVVFYVHGFLNEKKFVKMIVTEQITLSTFFYTLLTLEESAFIVGSIGLFFALALFMTITRKFDWYSGSFKAQTTAPPSSI